MGAESQMAFCTRLCGGICDGDLIRFDGNICKRLFRKGFLLLVVQKKSTSLISKSGTLSVLGKTAFIQHVLQYIFVANIH